MGSLKKIQKRRLAICFLLIIALFCSICIITVKELFTLGDLTKTIHNHPLVVSNASILAALNTAKMHRSMKDIVLANTPEEVATALAAVSENEQTVYTQLDIIRNKIIGSEGQALERQTRQLFSNWETIRNETVLLLESGNREGAILITKGKGARHVAKLETKMLELRSYAQKKADGFLKLSEKSQSRLGKTTIILTLAGVILSAVIAFIATYHVAKTERTIKEDKNKLKKALDEIKTLRGIIPICSHCKQIRDEQGLWKKIEEYVRAHSDATFSHSICPDCLSKHYSEFYNSNIHAEN